MKLVLIGPKAVDGRETPVWNAVRNVLHGLSPSDRVIHTGPAGCGYMIDSIKAHAKGSERKRLPLVDVQIPEIGRYERDEALRHNALQLLYHHVPDVIVYVGDGVDDEVVPLLALFAADGESPHPRLGETTVYTADEFIAARS